MNKQWSQEEIKLLRELHSQRKYPKEIAKIMKNKSYSMIQYKCKKLRLGRLPCLKNENFFERIDTEAKAYFLGLMYADGCVTEPPFGQKKVIINLKYHDQHILETFKEYLGLYLDVRFLNKRKKKQKFNTQNQYRICFTNDKICNDLIRLGCVPRKTFVLKFPDHTIVPDNLMNHFIRGLFDGDGCINIKKNGNFRFEIVGTFDITNGVNNFFHKKFGFKPIKLNFHKNSYKYSLGGNAQVEKIFDFIYKNANKSLFLIRKYNIFKLIKNKLNKPAFKTSRYKYICYRPSNNINYRWVILKWTGRKCKTIGKFKTEIQAYMELCKWEKKNGIPYSNNPQKYLNKINQ